MSPDFTDFKIPIVITEDEHTLLCQLLNQYLVEKGRAGEEAPFKSALLQKLLRTREDEIMRIRASATPETDDTVRAEQVAMKEPPQFGGKPGELVPVVDPEDLKIAWQIQRTAHANSPGKNVAVGFDVFKQACKPESDIQAVGYRTMLVWMMNHIAPQQLAPFMQDGEPNDSVFRAAATVPAEWVGVEVTRDGPPFDVNEFLKLCGEGPD